MNFRINEPVVLIEYADLFIGSFTVNEHESAADLLEYQLYFGSCNGKNIIHMYRFSSTALVLRKLSTSASLGQVKLERSRFAPGSPT